MTTHNNISIYIHHAHIRCNNTEIFRDTFNRVLGADCVRTVDLIKKTDKNNIPFVRAFIHFKFWPNSETAHKMYNELMMDKRLEITYNQDTKWFWRFCRSNITATRTPETETIDDLPDYPILQRIGHSRRNVSNKPAWMTRKFETGSVSDDGEY